MWIIPNNSQFYRCVRKGLQVSTNNVDFAEEFTCLSTCTGYGGLEMGLRRVIPNLRTIAYVEIEAFAVANLVAKIEEGKLDAAPIWTDIKTFPGEQFHGKVDFLTSGFPCQPFSVAGKRAGAEDPRHLWPHISRIIEAVRPVCGFFENVPGHLTLGFPEVYRSLRDMGYKVEAGLFTAAEVGAPHKRQRLFILANRERTEPRLRIRQEPQAGLGGDRLTVSGEGMADAGSCGRAELPRTSERSVSSGDGEGVVRWPARPGQPQYEWEEPRVVVEDTSRLRRTGTGRETGRGRGVCSTSKGQAERLVGE